MDKRRYARLVARVDITVKRMGDDLTDPWTVASKDISAGGVGIVSEKELRNGDLLRLDIKLPDDRMIRAFGVVKWMQERENLYTASQRDYTAGIEFTNINDDDRKMIDDFVAQAKFPNEGQDNP